MQDGKMGVIIDSFTIHEIVNMLSKCITLFQAQRKICLVIAFHVTPFVVHVLFSVMQYVIF